MFFDFCFWLLGGFIVVFVCSFVCFGGFVNFLVFFLFVFKFTVPEPDSRHENILLCIVFLSIRLRFRVISRYAEKQKTFNNFSKPR